MRRGILSLTKSQHKLTSVNVLKEERIPPRLGEKPLDQIFGNASVMRSKELEARGVSRERQRRAVAAGRLERLSRGLYALPGSEVTEQHSLVQVARRTPTAVICLLSALRFHELTTQNPHEVWIAVPRRTRAPVLEFPPLRVVHFATETFELGREEHMVEGTHLSVYSVARTVVDLFRFRHKLGLDVALEALREGWHDRRFSLSELQKIAKALRMSRVMQPYIESLIS